MVFLTALRCTARNYFYSGSLNRQRHIIKEQSRLPKRYQFKRLAAKYCGRARNCYILGIRIMKKALTYSTKDAETKQETMDRLYETRIAAACLEHGMDKFYFLTSLAEFDINLNRESLANLSIYEPRTFQTLVEFVKMRSLEIGLQSKELGAPMGLEPRGILEKVKRASNASSS